MNASPARERRHDLDWLRVLAILLLLFFHSAMPFVAEWGWHIKNAETSNLLLELNFFMSRWRMALLFLISGIGTSYALGFRSAQQYLRERALRLLIPLVFGMLIIVPPQIYLERLAAGAAYRSYLDFFPSVLELRPYPAGNTSWHHLWFIAYLFGYSVLLAPLFLWLRGPRGSMLLAALERRLDGAGLYLLGVPLALVLASLYPRFPGPQNVLNDWAFLIFYLFFFGFGFLLGRADGVWRRIEASRRTSLTLAFLATLAINYLRWNGLEPHVTSPAGRLYLGQLAFNSWFWVLAIVGYARRYLAFRNRFLVYANEGIYPFYILHQTLIVVVAFYVVQVQESVLAKFLFTSLLSLVLTAAIYDLFVRPFRLVRFLFGMKPPRAADQQAGAADAGRSRPRAVAVPAIRRAARLLLLAALLVPLSGCTSSYVGRWVVWNFSDVDDFRRFPSLPLEPDAGTSEFVALAEPSPIVVEVERGGSRRGWDLVELARATATTAPLVVRGDTLLFEG